MIQHDVEYLKLNIGQNKLNVITINQPHAARVSINVFVDVGSSNELDTEQGYAHFLEHCRFKSTKTRSTQEIAKSVEIIGADFNAYTSQNQTCYYAVGLNDTLNTLIDIMGDITCNSIFPEDEIERERDVVIQEMKMYCDNINSVANEALYDAAYGLQPKGHPILGNIKNIETVKQKDIIDFSNKHYNSETITVVVAGDIDNNLIKEMLIKYFSNIAPVSNRLQNTTKPKFFPQAKIVNKNFEHVVTNIAFNLNGCLSNELVSLAADALGSGMSSPLWQEVRQKYGLVYSVYSYNNPDRFYNELIFGYETTTDKNNKCLETIGSLIKHANDFVTADDITRATNQMLAQYAICAENPQALAHYYGSNKVVFDETIHIKERIDQIKNITASDIRNVLEMIKTNDFAMGMCGPIEENAPVYEVLKSSI